MCFSATACFTAGTILLPTGIYSLGKAYQCNKRYLALAAFPLLFVAHSKSLKAGYGSLLNKERIRILKRQPPAIFSSHISCGLFLFLWRHFLSNQMPGENLYSCYLVLQVFCMGHRFTCHCLYTRTGCR